MWTRPASRAISSMPGAAIAAFRTGPAKPTSYYFAWVTKPRPVLRHSRPARFTFATKRARPGAKGAFESPPAWWRTPGRAWPRWTSGMRRAVIDRRTTETRVTVKFAFDGRGRYRVATGVRFLDHMLELVARHGGFDLDLQA